MQYYSTFITYLSSINVLMLYNFYMEEAIAFKERFAECIRFSDVKQTELADAAKVSKQCISDYKSGKSKPSIDTLILICEFLDVSADYLLGLSD